MSMTEAEITEIVARVVAELQDAEVTPLAVTSTHFQVAPGQVIAADHVNSLANQSVPKYDSKAALLASWPAPGIGALAYLKDVNTLYVYDSQIHLGTANWHPLGSMRMGYGSMGSGQVIPGGSVDTVVKLTAAGGAAGKPGRATWAATGEVTVPTDGTYLISGSITWPGVNPASGERRVYIKRWTSTAGWTFTGVAGGMTELNTGAVGTTAIRMGVTAQALLGAGEKIALVVSHSASAAITLPTSTADIGKLAVHFLAGE